MTKQLRDRKRRWPADMEQLLPLGERGTIDVLLAFAETLTCMAPLSVLEPLLSIARPIVWPILVADCNRARFVALLASTLDASSISPTPAWMSRREIALRLAVNLLIVVHNGPDALPRDISRLVSDRGAPETLFFALQSAISRLPDNHVHFCELAHWCKDMYTRIPPPRPAPPKRALRWLEVYTTQPAPRSMAAAMENVVGHFLRTSACSAPGCGVSPLHTPGGKAFPICASCKLARYCSKDCQRRHWRGVSGTGAPHKDVCPLLRKFRAHYDPRDSSASGMYTTYAEVAKTFSEVEMDTLDEWIMASTYEIGYILPRAP